jgi:hypothetical protein
VKQVAAGEFECWTISQADGAIVLTDLAVINFFAIDPGIIIRLPHPTSFGKITPTNDFILLLWFNLWTFGSFTNVTSNFLPTTFQLFSKTAAGNDKSCN